MCLRLCLYPLPVLVLVPAPVPVQVPVPVPLLHVPLLHQLACVRFAVGKHSTVVMGRQSRTMHLRMWSEHISLAL